MNTLNKITFVLFTATALSVSASLSWADMDLAGHGEAGITSPVFEQAGNMISFEFNQSDGDAASLGTCTMNPMNISSYSATFEEYPIITPEVYTVSNDTFSYLDPTQASSTTGSIASAYVPSMQFAPVPVAAAQAQETPATPEPATMLIFGLGLAGLGLARRRK